jgi:hypothetical protein
MKTETKPINLSMWSAMHCRWTNPCGNVIFQQPVALYRSDFWNFCAVYVQRRSLFFLCIHLLDT